MKKLETSICKDFEEYYNNITTILILYYNA